MTKFRKKMVWKYNRKKLSEKGVLIRMMFHDEWLIDMEIERANVLVWMWMSVYVFMHTCVDAGAWMCIWVTHLIVLF